MRVEYPGFGVIVVEGARFECDVVIDAGAVRPRDKGPSRGLRAGHTPLSASEDLPWWGPTLMIGTGYSGMLPILDDVHEEAERCGVEIVALPTAEACSLLAGMRAEEVCAVLHVTC